jgi:hypothetical protein
MSRDPIRTGPSDTSPRADRGSPYSAAAEDEFVKRRIDRIDLEPDPKNGHQPVTDEETDRLNGATNGHPSEPVSEWGGLGTPLAEEPPLTAAHRAPFGGERPADPLPRRVDTLLADFLAESSAGVPWLAHGLIVEGGIAVFLGKPESFKTFAAIQLGLALASGGSWLGVELGEPRPFLYLSNEKSSATVRERFRMMTADAWPDQPVSIVHRRGVTFGDLTAWASVLAAIDALGGRVVVVVDSLASMSGRGFDENKGTDMSVALAALQELCDHGATVILIHHPNKTGEGSGGVRLRGHSSLHGQVDAVLEFTRPDRETEGGTIRAEPKDGDLQIFRFAWHSETFLMAPDTARTVCTARTVADAVALLFEGEALTADAILRQFPDHSHSSVHGKLAQAVKQGLVEKVGANRATQYRPLVSGRKPDASLEWGSEV